MALRATHGSSRPLYESLVTVWRAADEAFDASADRLGAPLLGKWVCRLLWEQLQRSEAAVPDRVMGLLVRAGVWTVEDAVFAVWAATLSRRSECGDDRYFEHALEHVLDCLDDSSLPELARAIERVDHRLDGLLAHRLVRRLVKRVGPTSFGGSGGGTGTTTVASNGPASIGSGVMGFGDASNWVSHPRSTTTTAMRTVVGQRDRNNEQRRAAR